jgi:hypothetical protein
MEFYEGTDIPLKRGRPSYFTDELYQTQLETHCKLLETIHRYYIEYEYWEEHKNYNSSRRMKYWLMRMLKQIKLRLLEIAKIQNSRDLKYDPEVYRKAYWQRIAREEQRMRDEIKAEIEQKKRECGL